MSQESIWEDTIAPNLDEIVDEITNYQNYGKEDTEITELCREAVCRKNMLEKLEANFSSMLKRMKEVDEADYISRAKAATGQATIFRTLHERYFDNEEALTFVQLHTELPYLKSSYLNGKFSVLINCDYAERAAGFAEHAFWQVT